MAVASLLSLGFAGSASAVTADVYLTGSSAFRTAATEAIAELLTTTDGGSDRPVVSYAQNTAGSATVANSGSQLFVGYPTAAAVTHGFVQHTQYWIHTDWTGSVAGIVAIADSVNPAPQSGSSHPYLPDVLPSTAIVEGSYTVTGSNGNISVTNPSGGQSLAVTAPTVDHLADGAFSDAYQSSTQYRTPVLTQANGHVVGVVPFVWVANPDAASFVGASGGKFTNINTMQAQELIAYGLDPAQLTGNIADDQSGSAPYIYSCGRNADSGTRLVTFAETGFNPVNAAIKQPQQYAVTTSGSNVYVDLYPAEWLFSGTPAAQYYTSGQSGYSSGGNQATAMKISGTSGVNSDNPSYLLGGIGESDGSTVVKGGGAYLSYNGIAYGSYSGGSTYYSRVLIDQGVYTDWGYEHLYIAPSTSYAGVMNAIAAQVKATDAPFAGELIANMAVQRDYEGGPIQWVGTGNSTK